MDHPVSVTALKIIRLIPTISSRVNNKQATATTTANIKAKVCFPLFFFL
jgi:hypothetical protein